MNLGHHFSPITWSLSNALKSEEVANSLIYIESEVEQYCRLKKFTSCFVFSFLLRFSAIFIVATTSTQLFYILKKCRVLLIIAANT